MQSFYSDIFVLPLPEGHRFPMDKYRLLRERLVSSRLLEPGDLRVPPAAGEGLLELAHCPRYVQRVLTGELNRREQNRIGFPWSPGMVERSRRSVGATVAAAFASLEDGVAANLAGGTHHAHRDRGEGYCVFNDCVVAARAVQRDRAVGRVLIVDLDVHQGNGTASIARDDPTIFTLSVHGASNFPARKEPGDLDVALPDGTGDAAYLAAVAGALGRAMDAARPQLLIYLAGADPFEGDRLGRLAVSKAGLAERDRLVLEAARTAGVPVTLTMAGGYAEDLDDIVDIHFQTLSTAAALARRRRSGADFKPL